MRVLKVSSFWCMSSACFLCFLAVLSLPVVTEAKFLNRVKSFFGYEVCEHPHVHDKAAKRLQNSLKRELFGQHLALDISVKALKAHMEDVNPSKALVLSLHGWAGSGKTFTSKHFMQALFQNGVNSSFVQFFMASYHFSDPLKVPDYQRALKSKVETVIRSCPRALFVFDEVDKTPPGILDVLVPYIHHPGQLIDGYDYKKATFIFISNTGANDITRITKDAWKAGGLREDLTFKDFEETLSNEAFNSKGNGLYRSRIIDKILVDYFIPFLPLERRHVVLCVKAEANRHGMNSSIIEEEAERIADMVSYWPADLKLYSTTGCKKVDIFVKYRMAELKLQNPLNEDDDEDDGDDLKTEL